MNNKDRELLIRIEYKLDLLLGVMPRKKLPKAPVFNLQHASLLREIGLTVGVDQNFTTRELMEWADQPSNTNLRAAILDAIGTHETPKKQALALGRLLHKLQGNKQDMLTLERLSANERAGALWKLCGD